MASQTVEFVNASGLFLEGQVIELTHEKIIVQDKQGRLWEGRPSQVIFPNTPNDKAIPLNPVTGKPHGTVG